MTNNLNRASNPKQTVTFAHMNRTCIWCKKSEPDVRFLRKAHIFPKSLGGRRFCSNVCDECNTFFGSKQAGLTSVEIAFKEPLYISQMFFRSQPNNGMKLPKFKAEYFDYNLQNQTLKPKYKYSRLSGFQTMFVKQFKRGVYKVFLEERSESVGDALSPQFDFIREFARYGLGDPPVFYCQPNIPAVMVPDDVKEPVMKFTEHLNETMKRFGFFSNHFISHLLAFPVIRHYELTLENYLRFLWQENGGRFQKIIPLREITDLDFTFSYAFGNNP